MDYVEMLRSSAVKHKSIVCLGADPLLEKIPVTHGTTEERIVKFYSDILDACFSSGTVPATVKANYGAYAQYGFDGLRALKRVSEKVKSSGLPLILDAKRGDAGPYSANYARESFDFWGADAVTVAPYMGSDSVGPFIEYCEQKGKGIYILNRTSNKGAADLQNLMVDGKHLFVKTAEKIVEWGQNARGNVGAVIGATSIQEFDELAAFYAKAPHRVPFLIPGVGKQGGSGLEVSNVLKKHHADLSIHRINSSREINYAYEKTGTTDYADAAVKAIQELNREIGFKP